MIHRIINFVLVGLLLAGCASLKREVELAQDAYVTVGKKPPTFRRKGEKIAVEAGVPWFIETPDKKPLLVYLPETPFKESIVTLPTTENTQRETSSIDDTASEFLAVNNAIVGELNDVYTELSLGKNAEALKRVQTVESRYPNLLSLKVVEAHCLLALGKRDEAIAALRALLKKYPEHPQATSLLAYIMRS